MRLTSSSPSRSGFSLLELSIVLTVLALIVGGVLVGRTMIRASELRAVTAESTSYTQAVMAFRDKYFALPGDIKNATQLWGEAASCPGSNADAAPGDKLTCDGDGDGQIHRFAPTSNETFRFWQHLVNAGLMEGTFTGVSNTGTADEIAAQPGRNVPKSRFHHSGWSVCATWGRSNRPTPPISMARSATCCIWARATAAAPPPAPPWCPRTPTIST